MERRDEPERRAYKVVTVPGMWDKVDCYPRDHEGNEDGPCKVKERSGMKTRPRESRVFQ